MTSAASLSSADLARAVTVYAELLAQHQGVINRLNVYPVPDGDTGTNMALTMAAVVGDLHETSDDATMAEVCWAISHGSLMGARGNSGVILSQMLRGLVKNFPESESISGEAFAQGLVLADELARHAVARPVEGTILSVARAAAEAASADTSSLESVVRHARGAAASALSRTPQQLDVLARAGVVDSGGSGLVLWFDALCHVVAGDAVPEVFEETPPLNNAIIRDLSSEGDQRYEVMFILRGDDGRVGEFRDAWEPLGDSIVVVGGDGLYNCHIHTNDIGRAIEASFVVGRPSQIRVSDLSEQFGEHSFDPTVNEEASPAPQTSVVAVVAGPGNEALFRSLGARAIVRGGQSANPSTAELIAAVSACGSAGVIILPNNPNILAVAQQIGPLVSAHVEVVDTDSVVTGMAAMVAYRPDDGVQENRQRMAQAATHTRSGQVTRAVRAVESAAGPVHVGDWIGVAGRDVVVVGANMLGATQELVRNMLGDGDELVTLIEGEGATAVVTAAIRALLAEDFPRLDVEVHYGGQALYPYIIGVE